MSLPTLCQAHVIAYVTSFGHDLLCTPYPSPTMLTLPNPLASSHSSRTNHQRQRIGHQTHQCHTMPLTWSPPCHHLPLALFPLSHHVIYITLDPRLLLDMIMRQGEQVVNQNAHAIAHDHQPVATLVSMRAHCNPTSPTAPPHSSHLRTPPRHGR
jgi:hypothetical protein